MEKFEIPWAPVFGSHDYEGRADKAKLAEIYEVSEHGIKETSVLSSDIKVSFTQNKKDLTIKLSEAVQETMPICFKIEVD